jgi:hypothetical protein
MCARTTRPSFSLGSPPLPPLATTYGGQRCNRRHAAHHKLFDVTPSLPTLDGAFVAWLSL